MADILDHDYLFVKKQDKPRVEVGPGQIDQFGLALFGQKELLQNLETLHAPDHDLI